MNVTEDIIHVLEKNNCNYELLSHDPVFTSEEAAAIRGTELRQGAKALVWTTGKDFIMTVASAEKRIDTSKLAKLLEIEAENLALARPKEVRLLTSCNIGSVPPFGHLFGIKVHADKSLFENEWIAFNAGAHTTSIKMKSEDYRSVAAPVVVDITED